MCNICEEDNAFLQPILLFIVKMPPVGVSKKSTRKVRPIPSNVKRKFKAKSKLNSTRKNNRSNLLAKRNKLSEVFSEDQRTNKPLVAPTAADDLLGEAGPQECKAPAFEIFHADSNTAVVGFQCFQKFVIHGGARIFAVKGKFEIQGHRFNPGIEHDVFAPLTHPACVLDVHETNSSVACQTVFDAHARLPKNVVSKVKEWGESCTAIAIFSSLINPPLPGYPDIYKVKPSNVEESQEICQGCWACKTNKHFVERNGYAEIAREIGDHSLLSSSSNSYPVVITTGGKNVGKSTFNRYLINKLLQRHRHVYYLECDVGQTEFTPSGILSITKVGGNEPLLGPPFTHQRKSLYSCFYGSNTPAGDPDRYIHCIEFLLHSLCSELHDRLDGPLVVNTMGWIRALGLQLLVDTIRMVRPTHVVQFVTDKESRNVAALSPDYLTSAAGWTTSPDPKKTRQQQYKHMTLTVEYVIPEVITYMAPDMRNLAMLSYLSNMADESTSVAHRTKPLSLLERLRQLPTRSISVNKVIVCNASGHPIKQKLAFAFLNASVVGLCALDIKDSESFKDDNSECLPYAPVCACLGLGLVVGVDPDVGDVVILSCLSDDLLRNVNCIICGNLNVPEPLVLEQKSTTANSIPFVTRNFPYTTMGAGMFRTHRKFSKLPGK